MWRSLFIFALLFASCEVEEESSVCRFMTFSDGLPVQFWLTDCETFNEKEVPGINRACWCQPFNCDDEINIQFQGDTGGDNVLEILDNTGSILASLEFEEIEAGIYFLSFTPQDEDICDAGIQLRVLGDEVENEIELTNPDFTGSMTGWLNTSFGLIEWSYATNAVSVDFGSPFGASESEYLYQAISPLPAGTSFEASVSIGSSTEQVYLAFSNDLVTWEEFLVTTNTASGQLENSAIYVAIKAIKINSGPSAWHATVSGLSASSFTRTEIAKSDCLHIKTAHSGTKLIEYSNNRNFAGLIYEDTSPVPNFFLRVPAVFFHPRFPQESRAIERTTSTVVTSSKLKKQRLMQVEHAPAYFHEKIILALSHHNVEIDGKQWKKEEAYEIDDGDPRYPLKKATVYLTEKNFLARNVL